MSVAFPPSASSRACRHHGSSLESQKASVTSEYHNRSQITDLRSQKRRLEQELSWSKRHQKYFRYAYNLDLAKATRWHGKCKETEQELLDDFMDDPDVQEGRTIILANRVKSCYQVRIDSLEQIENLKLK